MTHLDMKLIKCDFKPLTKRSVPGHSHKTYEWHYVVAGRCGFDIDERRLSINTGDLFVVEPGTVHGVRMRRRGDWLLQYILQVEMTKSDMPLLQAWLKEAGSSELMNVGSARHGLFARLHYDLNSHDPWLQAAATHRFSALLCESIARESPLDDAHPHIQACLRFMHQHLYELLSVDKLAAHLSLNKSYLIRLFKQHIGQAPLQYFTDMKMAVAARMLRDEKLPVQDVSDRIGYAAAAHFSRQFKQWSGMSPAHYVRAHQQD